MTGPTEQPLGSRSMRPDLRRIAMGAGAAVLVLAVAAVAFGAVARPSPDTNSGPLAQANPGDTGWYQSGQGVGPAFGDWGDRGKHGFRGLGPGRVGFAHITISSISGSGVTLKTDDGWTRTITVTDATAITKGGQKIALGDLKVGDQIRFHETRKSDGSYTITAIEVVAPKVAGSVTALSASGFTLKGRDGTSWTITLTDSTAYTLGPNTGSKSDVQVGRDVVVAGTQTSDNALTALSVHVQLARVVGQVTAKASDTITIQRLNDTTMTIHVGSGTTYKVQGVSNASLSDISVGMLLEAQGTQNADGSLQAVAVYARSKI